MKSGLCYRFWAAGQPETLEVIQWVARSIPGCERGWDKSVTMDVRRDGKRVGAVVYHDYNPEAETMCMSAAGSDGWLTRPVLYAMHAYVFDDAACQLAVLQVAEDNHLMRSIAKRYGYEEFRIPRLRGRDRAEMIMTLTEETWRASRFTRSITHG